MPGIIAINGDSTTAQPSELKEGLKQKVHDRVSLKGTYTRVWIAQKHHVTMKFTAINQSQYATLMSYLTGTANPVHYQNFDSGFSFTGFPTVAEDTYYKGASLLKDLTVQLEEK